MLDFELEDRGAERFLDNIEDRLQQPEHLLDVLVDQLHDYERDVFSSSGNGDWPALSESTVRQKGSSRILFNTGDLFDQLTSSKDLMGDEATVSTDLAYAGLLKSGTGRMPARDPAPEPPESVTTELAQSLLNLIVDGHR